MRLSDVPVGHRVVVHALTGAAGDLTRRLEDLGFLPGTTVHVERRAPLGDPVVYHVRGARLAMRRRDVAGVEVVPEMADHQEGARRRLRRRGGR